VDVVVTVADGSTGDEVRELRSWLVGEDELRGHVRPVERGPSPDELGGLVEALIVGLGPGGAAAAFASVVISWIGRRSGGVRVLVRRPDGAEVEVQAERVRGMDATQLRSLVEELSGALSEGDQIGGGGNREAAH
jgi:hypothetical protein